MRYMRRGGFMSKYKAHIISMALIGLWHGANWTFIVFGLYWGIVIAVYLAVLDRTAGAARGRSAVCARAAGAGGGGVVERLFGFGPRARELGATALMFALVCVGWVFFRA